MNDTRYEERFGNKVREKRKEKRISQETLAELCDLSTRHISDIENGKVDPRLGTAAKLCTVCGIHADELFEIVLLPQAPLHNFSVSL